VIDISDLNYKNVLTLVCAVYFHAVRILEVEPNSIAAQYRLRAGDDLRRINGHPIRDALDYQFYAADSQLELAIAREGKLLTIQIHKLPEEELGVEVEPLKIRPCANNCVFCFADQNPPGVRESLNFKDGDYRFSFLAGHYITMTNMGPKHLERVVQQRLSPLYISVHVTNPDVRRKLFGLKKEDYLLEKIEYLVAHGIELHTQIVVCPGWNDGQVLEQTLADLHRFTPGILSITLVPVGLTKWRQNLTPLQKVTAGYAKEFLARVPIWEGEYRRSDGQRLIFLSDEWFLLAGAPIPPTDYYGDFALLENGVGQCRNLAETLAIEKEDLPSRLSRPVRLLFPTGRLVAPWLKRLLRSHLDSIENLEWELIPVANNWLGANEVTVTGLLGGRDISEQVRAYGPADMVWLPEKIFNSDGLTLDDWDLEKLEREIGLPVDLHHESLVEILAPWS